MDSSADGRLLAVVDQVAAAGPWHPRWRSLSRAPLPRWFSDAKFGIFVHWGVFSVPAYGDEWYPRNMYRAAAPEYAYHRDTFGPQDAFGYKDFIPAFTCEEFDPDAWAALFRAAGAQYVIPVAEHHDGFALYPTELSRWNAGDMGPRRDLLGELAAAVRRQSMRWGLSYHRAEHWWFMNGGMRCDSDVRDPAWADFYGPAQREEIAPHREFLDNWLARLAELIEAYDPDLIYLDTYVEHPAFRPYLKRLAAYYYNRANHRDREASLVYKWQTMPPGCGIYDVERGGVAGIADLPWQSDTAISRTSWGFVAEREGSPQEYKPAGELIAELIDVVARRGCLLLNVGPKPDGTLTDQETAVLRAMGRWLDVNGEAIYGTAPWRTAGEGPTEVATGAFSEAPRGAYTAQDIRFTTRTWVGRDYLYAMSLRWPHDGVVRVRELGGARGIERVELLGNPPLPTEWEVSDEALTVRLPPGALPVVEGTGAVLKIWLRPAPGTEVIHLLHG